jgi:heme-degrading monooxygenase HmoA
MAGFVARLEEINSLAESAPGFVWRLKDDSGDATNIQAFDDPLVIVNMSVWESAEHLRDFVYRSDHAQVMRQRRSWFERFDGVYLVMWWVPTGHRPTVEEAKERMAHRQQHGDSPRAFSFTKLYPAPDQADRTPLRNFSDPCPAL